MLAPTASATSPNKTPRLLPALAAMVFLYLILCWFMDHRGFQPVVVDSHSYLEAARTLRNYGEFSHELPSGLREPEYARTPGYPLFLAAFSSTPAPHTQLFIWTQRLFWAAFALGFTLILYRPSPASATPRLATAALLLFLPVSLVVTSSILAEALFTILTTVGLLSTARALTRRSHLHAAFAGLALGAATLVRPAGLHLPLILASCGWAFFRPRTQLARILVPLLLFAYLLPAGWMVRNYAHSGHFALSSLTGPGLALHRTAAISNLDPAALDEPHQLFIRETKRSGDVFHALAAIRHEFGMGDFDTASVAQELGLAALRAAPLDYLRTSASNLASTFASASDALLLADLVAPDARLKETSLTGAYRTHRYGVLALHLAIRALYLATTLLLPAWLLWRNRTALQRDPLLPLALAAAAYMIVLPAALTITYDRFLFPVLPVVGIIYCRATNYTRLENHRG